MTHPRWRRAVAALTSTFLIATASATAASAAPDAGDGPELVTDPLPYVDPMVGTGEATGVVGEINNFPGPSMPYGMMQLSPDTPGSYAGYRHRTDRIKGFSTTHAAAGCGIFGDVPILPVTGDAGARPWERTERYDHGQEEAEVGRYAVTLLDSDVDVELSAATRSGGLDIAFPDGGGPGTVIVNAGGSLSPVTGSTTEVVGDSVLTGSVTTGRFCSKPNRYTLYYSIEFDQPFESFATWQGQQVRPGERSASNARSGATLTFPAGSEVRATVGISYVDVAGATRNRETEIPDFDYAATQQQAREAWAAELGRIRVASRSETDLTMFYTSLYHSLLHPNTFSDVDGRVIGFDDQIRTLEDGRTQYANFSDWDTYRSLGALQTILDPDRASDMAQSLVDIAEQTGWLPRWPVANGHVGQMSGDSSVPLLASMYAFGARDFDVATALEYMVKGATSSGATANGYVQRRGIETYLERGYAPQMAQYRGDHGINGASITLEWSIADFAIATLARELGRDDVEAAFRPRSQWWQNVFDPAQNGLAARNVDGTFVRPTAGGFGQEGFDEGNAEQYLWLVPQNVAALMESIGGREAAVERLDTFTTELNSGPSEPTLWIGNEPNFGVPWIYNYLGEPARASALIDRIVAELFQPVPNGKPGNDDLGAQAGWYVWAALGLYPVTPGTDVVSINTPRFDRSEITLAGGGTLAVEAPGASDGKRVITGMTIDGEPWSGTALPEDLIHDGGTIAYTLGESDTGWGAGTTPPPSFRDGERSVIVGAPDVRVAAAPGESVTAQLDLRVIGYPASDLTVAVDGDEHVTATAAPLDPMTNRLAVTLAVGPDAPGGTRTFPVRLSAPGTTEPVTVPITLTVSGAGSIGDLYDVVGTADESDARVGDFDRQGNSYSRQQLAAQGLTPGSEHELGELTFTWPAAPHGSPDTIRSAGQTVRLDDPTDAVAFVGAATNGRQGGDAVLHLDDGASVTTPLTFGDWIFPTGQGSVAPIPGNEVVARMTKRNGDQNQVFVFATAPALAPEGRRIVSVTLPTNPDLMVFSIATAPVPPDPEVPTFSDVAEGGLFAKEISWLASSGLSRGWDDGAGGREFRPLAPVARDAMAAFLYRASGSPAFEPPVTSPFTDVAPGDEHYLEIAWLAHEGISTGWVDAGTGHAEFRPLAPVARDAMAAFLHRAAGSPEVGGDGAAAFPDVPASAQFADEIAWLASEGIATGWHGNDGTAIYRPLASVNRDAMAAFLYRAAEAGHLVVEVP
ncbi:GH92 family glycosyl hydrolase [Litorihabitans aurantiacus]|uniref:SLH domain-containing protein n=1 Tax=Litorihabitans aurantiacus TaxID=1930061 RepID=A0AA38CTW1_9MICO|nr:GH92 family glycosyl hydrolase [Litorihabitans aurantiacus]GMA31675.1 hypothetical protein GCM10025875_16670 [Litorihabitans aurantiacus]